MAKDLVCRLPHLKGKAIKVGAAVYKIAADGLAKDVDDTHAEQLLELAAWDEAGKPAKAEAHGADPHPAEGHVVNRHPPLAAAYAGKKRGPKPKGSF